MSFAYYAPGVGSPVTTLTSAQLNSLFTTGPQNIGGVDIVPCSIQLGSGTYQFWNTALGVSASQMASATASCTPAGQEIQENDANGLKAKGDALGANKQYIIGFSAANFISQTNGVAGSQLPAPAGTVDLGAIDALGKPYTGAVAGPIAPSATFYASTTYGRNVYNVLPTTRGHGPRQRRHEEPVRRLRLVGVQRDRHDPGVRLPRPGCRLRHHHPPGTPRLLSEREPVTPVDAHTSPGVTEPTCSTPVIQNQ